MARADLYKLSKSNPSTFLPWNGEFDIDGAAVGKAIAYEISSNGVDVNLTPETIAALAETIIAAQSPAIESLAVAIKDLIPVIKPVPIAPKIWKPKLLRVTGVGVIVGAQSVSIGNEGAASGYVTTSGVRTEIIAGGFSPTFTAPAKEDLIDTIEYDATGTIFSIAILLP